MTQMIPLDGSLKQNIDISAQLRNLHEELMMVAKSAIGPQAGHLWSKSDQRRNRCNSIVGGSDLPVKQQLDEG